MLISIAELPISSEVVIDPIKRPELNPILVKQTSASDERTALLIEVPLRDLEGLRRCRELLVECPGSPDGAYLGSDVFLVPSGPLSACDRLIASCAARYRQRQLYVFTPVVCERAIELGLRCSNAFRVAFLGWN